MKISLLCCVSLFCLIGCRNTQDSKSVTDKNANVTVYLDLSGMALDSIDGTQIQADIRTLDLGKGYYPKGLVPYRSERRDQWISKNRKRITRYKLNYLVDFPERALSRLYSLESLYLDNNQIKTIPEHSDVIERLKYLDLSSNNLTNGMFRKLTLDSCNLVSIDLSKNTLGRIPEFLLKCDKIQKIDMSHNYLVQFDKRFLKMKSLDTILLWDALATSNLIDSCKICFGNERFGKHRNLSVVPSADCNAK